MYSKSLKRVIKLVHVIYKNKKDIKKPKLYFSTDLTLEAFENAKTEDQRWKAAEKAKTEVMAALKKRVRAEFLNRIDEILMFKPLSKEEVKKIVKIQLNNVTKMLQGQNIQIEFTEHIIDYLADKGFDPEFGARPVKRVIQKDVLNQLSKDVLAGKISSESKIIADFEDEKIVFKNK